MNDTKDKDNLSYLYQRSTTEDTTRVYHVTSERRFSAPPKPVLEVTEKHEFEV